ncbi:MAG: NUDIX domain-containing protein [Christensenellaceae bacterium]|jgi:isopentenyldiphosphate isomerase|nr:NUDIX domain-containing protein [Christensenellaceae bacterium]
MEEIDLYLESGLPAGQRMEKDLAHERGLLHRAVAVWLQDEEGRLILQRRSESKLFAPNLLDISFAGHLRAGENAAEAILREAQEELGLSLDLCALQYLFSCRDRFDGGPHLIENEIVDLYLYKTPIRPQDCSFADGEVSGLTALPWREIQALWRKKDPSLVPYEAQFAFLFQLLEREPSLGGLKP